MEDEEVSAAQKIADKHLGRTVSDRTIAKLLLDAQLQAQQWQDAYQELALYVGNLEQRIADLSNRRATEKSGRTSDKA